MRRDRAAARALRESGSTRQCLAGAVCRGRCRGSIRLTHPLENLLRRPVELYSACAWLAAAGALAARPEWAVLTPAAASLGALGLAAVGLWRARDGVRLLRYRRRLRVLPRFALAAGEIPVSSSGMYLGRGFDWDVRHATRMTQVREGRNAHLARPTPGYLNARRLARWCEQHGWGRAARALSADHPANPWRPLPPVGGYAPLHAVGLWEGEQDAWLDSSERVGHKAVIGTTRCGKSRLLELTLIQDVRRGGNVVIVMDPKGDAGLMTRAYVEARRAGRPFYLFHLGFPDVSARYNPIGEFTRITEVATRISNNLPAEGQSAAFRDFVWRYVNVIARSQIALGERPSYRRIYRHAAHIDPLLIRYFENLLDSRDDCRAWRDEIAAERIDPATLDKALKVRMQDAVRLVQFVRRRALHDDVADALAAVLSNEKSYFEKLVSSLFPLMEKLTTGAIADVLSPDYDALDDPRMLMDWEAVINQGAVVYMGFDALTDREVAGAVGNAALADLVSAAGRRYKYGSGYGQPQAATVRVPIILKIDEFNELIGKEAVPLLNKSGGADFEVECYTQSIDDIEARLESKAAAHQVLSNFNTLVMLRVVDEQTARYLTDKLDEVPVPTLVPKSGATDTNDPERFDEFSSRNEDSVSYERQPLVSAADVVKLPRGQAFVLMNGGQLKKLRIPLALPDPDEELPASIVQIAAEMRSRYERHFGTDLQDGDSQATPASGDGVAGLTVEGRGSGF
ncbi:MAG: type IV conjugative transfer system coupling protein TraD [Rhodocyclaceae bacterium]|nr:type IV conjugative transfer system coupling protein TraD [Rhodocyclaceae bacterium]